MIVTDWADINNLYQRERIAKDKKEAIAMAINAGIDMAMEPYQWDYCTLLKELVEEGTVPMERIDDATRRVLRLKYRLGLFDDPMTRIKDYPDFASEKHSLAARETAIESAILRERSEGDILPHEAGHEDTGDRPERQLHAQPQRRLDRHMAGQAESRRTRLAQHYP